MIKKVFKTIFILTLTLGISLPANAGTANVSEGSAFITKSEMSYQLNNLSNRMTQLENSLDSKIDTLVSSYLTRNGIWNGVKQTLTTSTFAFPTPLTATMDYNPYDLSVNGTMYDLFDSTKSGLAYVYLYWKAQYSGDNAFWGYSAVPIDTSRNKNVSDDSIFISLYFFNQNGDILTSLPLSNAKGSMQGFSSGSVKKSFMICAPCPKENIYLTTQFFVNKGETYSVQFRASVLTGYSDGATALSPNSGGTQVWFTDAYVY